MVDRVVTSGIIERINTKIKGKKRFIIPVTRIVGQGFSQGRRKGKDKEILRVRRGLGQDVFSPELFVN